ncbi:MAG: hypothetical protein WCA07_14580 [Gloeobacterales cyanobacterium]
MEQNTTQPIKENLWWVTPGKLAGVRKPMPEVKLKQDGSDKNLSMEKFVVG